MEKSFAPTHGGLIVTRMLITGFTMFLTLTVFAVATTHAAPFTDNGNGTLTDNVTGLIWQQAADDTTRTWQDALGYCNNNPHPPLPGRDWRLPNIKELESIVDDTRFSPAIDPVFTGTALTAYWSATTYASTTSNAWQVDFNYGNVGSALKTDTAYVRCVHSGGFPTVTSSTGKVWMDRNLGASQVATAFDDSAAFGDLYQWGRGTDGHEKRDSSTTSTLSTTDTPVHGDFITTSSSPYDWRNPQNDNLWQGVTGINNPCPSGFRLPTEAEWEAERLTWLPKDRAGAFASPLKLVSAGSRSSSDGSILIAGSFGYYWSSSVDGDRARYLLFVSGFANSSDDFRARGFSARCLED